jgi:hypothetical protein
MMRSLQSHFGAVQISQWVVSKGSVPQQVKAVVDIGSNIGGRPGEVFYVETKETTLGKLPQRTSLGVDANLKRLEELILKHKGKRAEGETRRGWLQEAKQSLLVLLRHPEVLPDSLHARTQLTLAYSPDLQGVCGFFPELKGAHFLRIAEHVGDEFKAQDQVILQFKRPDTK